MIDMNGRRNDKDQTDTNLNPLTLPHTCIGVDQQTITSMPSGDKTDETSFFWLTAATLSFVGAKQTVLT